MIRGSIRGCPFGLDIPYGCKNIGSYIDFMPLESEGEPSMERNFAEMVMSSDEHEGERCRHADVIMDKDSDEGAALVDCKYSADSDLMPAGSAGIAASPLHPHWYVGDMPQPLKGLPLTHVSDDNNSHEYFGSIYTDLIGAMV